MREAERLLAALASHGVDVRLAPDGRLIVRGRAPRPTALLAEARKRAKALAELLRQRGATSPPKEEASEHPPKEVISGRVAAEPPHFPRKIEVVQPCSHAATPKTQPADGAGQRLWWPSWAEAFLSRLEAAGLAPRLVVSKGHRGEPVLAVEAICPSCGWVAGLVAWPLSVGTMAGRCRAGCKGAEVFRCLDKLAKREDRASFCPGS